MIFIDIPLTYSFIVFYLSDFSKRIRYFNIYLISEYPKSRLQNFQTQKIENSSKEHLDE